MLKYPCLVLDHDDTVVQSEITVNYPYFCQLLAQLRPGVTITEREYTEGCYHLGFVNMCKQVYNFTDYELQLEYAGWKEYIKNHIPEPYDGIQQLIHQQKKLGGYVCVVSHSTEKTILRDYETHIGIKPDAVYGWDLPEEHRKPNPYPLQDIMKKYDLSPTQLLVIDDMKPAWEMSQKVGCAVAFAGWGRQGYPGIIKEMTAICDYAFDSVYKLYDFLFKD